MLLLLLEGMAMNEVVGGASRKGWSMDEVVGGASWRGRGMDEVMGRACRRVVEGGYDDLILTICKVDERYRNILICRIGNHHRGSHRVLFGSYRDGRGNHRDLLC